jgi:hypothetical protein
MTNRYTLLFKTVLYVMIRILSLAGLAAYLALINLDLMLSTGCFHFLFAKANRRSLSQQESVNYFAILYIDPKPASIFQQLSRKSIFNDSDSFQF